MVVEWIKCVGGGWCSFSRVDLTDPHFNGMEGVYVIWRSDGKAVRVGQGVIKERIAAHRGDPQITQHNPVYVAWARVPAVSRDGVERFLANRLQPLEGSIFPLATPIQVNLPR